MFYIFYIYYTTCNVNFSIFLYYNCNNFNKTLHFKIGSKCVIVTLFILKNRKKIKSSIQRLNFNFLLYILKYI